MNIPRRLGRLLPGAIGILVVIVLLVLALTQSPAERETPDSMGTPTGQARVADADGFSAARSTMVERDVRGRGLEDATVLAAMERVPRHEFVPVEYLERAYDDTPLPIGYAQTISQPYIVALMTSLLELSPGDKVLEVGTGSGYQAAVLAEITPDVYSVEIIPELAELARERLQRLGYQDVQVRNADGYYGWEEHGPYDAIVVTAAPDHIPPPLIGQLKDGAKMVIPVGPVGSYQTLWRLTREGDQVQSENMGGVIFVPLTGEH